MRYCLGKAKNESAPRCVRAHKLFRPYRHYPRAFTQEPPHILRRVLPPGVKDHSPSLLAVRHFHLHVN
jgi:hypothetical protein